MVLRFQCFHHTTLRYHSQRSVKSNRNENKLISNVRIIINSLKFFAFLIVNISSYMKTNMKIHLLFRIRVIHLGLFPDNRIDTCHKEKNFSKRNYFPFLYLYGKGLPKIRCKTHSCNEKWLSNMATIKIKIFVG